LPLAPRKLSGVSALRGTVRKEDGWKPAKEEIEITPEMIEAGFAVLIASGIADAYSEVDKCTVAEIFRAMVEASRPSLRRAEKPASEKL
jgi:hypothetical protein